MASDNKTLARFILDGVPPAPRGVPQVEVTFDIDTNGILNVSAKDKATGKSQSVKIEASTSLSKDEVERLKREATEHAAEDTKRREFVEAKNQAEGLVYLAEKSLRDAGDKVDATVKSGVQEKIDTLKKTLEGEDPASLKAASDALSQEIQKIGQVLYNQQDKPSGDTQPESS